MAYYFKHDDNARRDPKITRLLRIRGMKGYGIYWALIEILHEQNGQLSLKEISDIAFELREDEENILSVIKEFGLFVIQDEYIGNTRVSESLEERHKKSRTGKNNVSKRWNKQQLDNKEVNTMVIPKEYNGNTIREENIREDKKYKTFSKPSIEEVKAYCIERKNQVDPIRWIDHYTSNGWMVGKNKMKDWKAAIRTWEKSNFSSINQNTSIQRAEKASPAYYKSPAK